MPARTGIIASVTYVEAKHGWPEWGDSGVAASKK